MLTFLIEEELDEVEDLELDEEALAYIDVYECREDEDKAVDEENVDVQNS